MAPKNDMLNGARKDFIPEKYTKKHIANSSIITMFQSEEQTLFFRECRRHAPMKQYLYECIEDYFENVCSDTCREEIKSFVLCDFAKKENYKKAIRITEVFNANLMEILSGAYRGYAETGFPSFAELEGNDEFLAFIKFFSCAVISQKTNAYLKSGSFENFSANKQLATYRLACLLGIDRMIPAVCTCSFFDGSKNRVGTMMEKAEGVPPSDILPDARKNFAKGTFIRDITTLEYFDALCYQLDHRLDNYYVTSDENGCIQHVVAFDNDAARTFFVSPALPKSTYANATCVLSKDGTAFRPYIDKNFADKLLSISKNDVKKAVGEYLSFSQLYCLNQRIKKLQDAVRKTAEQRMDFLVSDWQNVDTENAANSKWGKTYFDLYLNDTLMLDREKLFEKMRNQQQ